MDDDKFHLNRADDGFKNLSNDNLEAIRILNGANKDTGFWDTDTGNLNDDIVNLARNIGLDDDVSGAYRFSDFAKEMGMDDYDPMDLHSNEVLKQRMADKFEQLKNNEKNPTTSSKYNRTNSGREAFDRKVNNKNYYKDELNNAKDRKETAKNNLKKASDNKDKTKDRLNQARQRRNSIPREQRTSSDKEEYKNAKSAAKEAKANEKKEKNNLKDAKKDIFNAKKDNLKSKAYQARHPIEAAKSTAKAAAKAAVKKAAKKILIKIAPYVIGFILIFLLAFFVIELIVGPIMEAWGNLEEGVTNVADFSEKLTNFYNGFGFQDSKEAFYDELNDLCDKYTCSNNGSGLDAPLLLTTIFYSEERGYDTDYENIADGLDEEGDPEEDLFESIKNSIIEKYYKESTTTTDENGIEYSTGKVYRLRKLAKNQVKSSGSSYSFDEEKYKTYLFDKYFEKMPEYKKLLGNLTVDQKVSKKEELYNDIISNKDLFKDIFLQYADADSESYIDSCLGAIDVNLVSELQKPVNIPDGTTVSFSDQYAYGVVDGKYHNGVDLNETTAAVSLGSNVYSVANGTIESISNLSGCTANSENVCAKTIKISHNIVIDSSEYKFSTIYTNIISKEGLSINSNINKGDILGTIASTNNDEGLHFSFMDNKESSSGTIIDPTNLFITCSTSADDWKIHNIVLSKNDFKNKLQSYCSRVGCGSSMQLFVNNSDLIYDTAKRNNVNPELVVVRAVNEGFSPGGGSNNYWGIGCTNTGGVNACSRYSSLSDGVKGFASISPVKNSETASEMMSTYAYIGDYWYNPGSWSLGGCAYYPSINGYMSSSRSVTVGGYCETSRSCSGSSCNKTIDEDQQAYSKWQVEENLIKRRKEIFGY